MSSYPVVLVGGGHSDRETLRGAGRRRSRELFVLLRHPNRWRGVENSVRPRRLSRVALERASLSRARAASRVPRQRSRCRRRHLAQVGYSFLISIFHECLLVTLAVHHILYCQQLQMLLLSTRSHLVSSHVHRLLVGELADAAFEGVSYFAEFLSKLTDTNLIFKYVFSVLERDQLLGAKVRGVPCHLFFFVSRYPYHYGYHLSP